MHIAIADDRYTLAFDYDPDLIAAVRRLVGARYHPVQKYWSAQRCVPNAYEMLQWGFNDAEILANNPRSTTPSDDFTWNLSAIPFDHQVKFQTWCRGVNKLLLRADMGTGKTLMAIMWLAEHKVNPDKVLVVCPPSLIGNWQAELKQWAGVDAHVVQGTTITRRKALSRRGLHVLNYEYCQQPGGDKATLRPEIASLGKTVLILDESHKLKNPSTLRSKVFHTYGSKMQRIAMLTGTPISQGAHDYFSQFKVLNPQLLGSSFAGFKTRYCVLEQVRGAPTGVSRIVGYRNLEELNRIIAPYTYDIKKEDCLNLPPKRYQTIFVDLTPEQRKFYKQMKNEMIVSLKDQDVPTQNILSRMIKLMQITQGFIRTEDGNDIPLGECTKLPVLAEMLEADMSPLVVVCRFIHDVKSVKALCDKLDITNCVIDGSIEIPERKPIVDDFQAGKYRVLIGQIQTVGVGFNMTIANRMVFYSNSYSLVDREQAEDRIHRIGTTGDHCLYIDLIANDTLDMNILGALRSKKDVSEMLAEMREKFVDDI